MAANNGTQKKRNAVPLEERRYRAQVKSRTNVKTDEFRTKKATAYRTKEHDFNYIAEKYFKDNPEKQAKLREAKKGSSVRIKTTDKNGGKRSKTNVRVVRTYNARCGPNGGSCNIRSYSSKTPQIPAEQRRYRFEEENRIRTITHGGYSDANYRLESHPNQQAKLDALKRGKKLTFKERAQVDENTSTVRTVKVVRTESKKPAKKPTWKRV